MSTWVASVGGTCRSPDSRSYSGVIGYGGGISYGSRRDARFCIAGCSSQWILCVRQLQRSSRKRHNCDTAPACQVAQLRPLYVEELRTTKAKSNFSVRAERGSSTRPRRYQSSSPEYWPEGESDELRDNNVWDSNAEGVRRHRTKSARDYTSEDSRAWDLPNKEWDYDSEGKPSADRWQWWRFSSDDDDYDEEYDEEEDTGFSTAGLNFDLKSVLQEQVFSSLRWAWPLVLMSLPWFFVNPILFMIGLAVLPTVQKALGPSVSEIWQAFLDFLMYPSSKPKRKRRDPYYEQGRSTVEGAGRSAESYGGWGAGLDNRQPYDYSRPRSDMNGVALGQEDTPYRELDADTEKFSRDAPMSGSAVGSVAQQASEVRRVVKMGGWDELEVDRRRRMPVRRAVKSNTRLGRKTVRRDQPVFFRLLVALFPFLRNWGGWLSVLLFVQGVDVFNAIIGT